MPLDMANITDDQIEKILAFARQVSRFKLYGTEMDVDGDDAVECMNDLIEEARQIVGQ